MHKKAIRMYKMVGLCPFAVKIAQYAMTAVSLTTKPTIDGPVHAMPESDSPKTLQEKDLDLTTTPDLLFHDELAESDVIIVSGEDVSTHLLSLRDDGDSPLTFRSIFLATGLSAFAAVMYQIYMASRRFT